MLKIEITTTAVDVKSGVSQKNKPYEIRSQVAYLHVQGEVYPVKFSINLRDAQPYNKGFYSLSPDSFYVDVYQNLSVNPVLVPFVNPDKK